MSSRSKRKAWHYRPLLTETLPYELPVIFGNEGLYYGRCKDVDPIVGPLISNVFSKADRFTIPYNFHIRKDSSRQTLLSLLHPQIQIEFCDFYSQYENALLDQCRRSHFSLRYPAALAAVYAAQVDGDNIVHKVGQVELLPEDLEVELSRLVSYFVYEKYTLLNKFYESKEFIRLEKRFPSLRQIDISKCFYSIYTHSIAWSTRSKEFAKSNVGAHYFEAVFDSLMQRANHNETNGIVVGPEVSRIFAEIILQGVDAAVYEKLRAHGLFEGRHYALRRYVDDYSIFANSEDDLKKIEKEIRDELGKFKLYVNESKVRTYQRPFVSPLSLARTELRQLLMTIKRTLGSESWKQGVQLTADDRHVFNSLLTAVRNIVHRHEVEVGNISGSLISELRTLVRLASAKAGAKTKDGDNNWSFAIGRIVECAFYVAAVDLRVRTTYGLCQLLSLVKGMEGRVSAEPLDQTMHLISEELASLCRSAEHSSRDHDRRDCVELFNVLICGAHVLGSRFLKLSEIADILASLLAEEATYFKYICLKYCFLQDQNHFASCLEQLNQKIEAIAFDRDSVRQRSEHFHLFCDFLSAPDLPVARKRDLYVRVFGGTPSNAAVEQLAALVGFVDWKGLAIAHTLRRRQLRPVYAMA